MEQLLLILLYCYTYNIIGSSKLIVQVQLIIGELFNENKYFIIFFDCGKYTHTFQAKRLIFFRIIIEIILKRKCSLL